MTKGEFKGDCKIGGSKGGSESECKGWVERGFVMGDNGYKGFRFLRGYSVGTREGEKGSDTKGLV